MCAASFDSVFERKEKKYLLSADQYQAILAGLEGKMEADDYGATSILSTYLDTPDHRLIERSLESPLYKEKLRVRSYGQAGPADRVFVEIKKKFKGVVYKRRVGMSRRGVWAYLSGMPYELACNCYPLDDPAQQAESLDARGMQIAREIDAFCQRYGELSPSILISVLRTAYRPFVGTEEEACQLRITFDEQVRYQDLSSRLGLQKDLLAPGQVIMELKCLGSYPLWLAELLSKVKAYPRPFSKCGEAYKCITGRPDALDNSLSIGSHNGSRSGFRGGSREESSLERNGQCSPQCSPRSTARLTA